jgi:glycosyltransferase involved in cell wall biosynthesis
MPTFNRAYVIRNAIESVIGQTFRDWRLVVIDNHSTDETWDLLNREYGSHPKIQLVRNDRNIGGNPNLDRCLEFAEGEWLGILADDDTYRLHTLQTIHDNVVHRPDLILWTHGQFVHAANTLPRALPVHTDVVEFHTSELATRLYRRGNIFGSLSSYFLHIDSLRRSQVTFSDGTACCDLHLYIRFLKKYPQQKAIYWPDLLTSVDMGENTASHQFGQTGVAQLDIVEHIGVMANLGWPKKLLLWQMARLLKCSVKYRRFLTRTPRGRRAPFVAARRVLNAFFNVPG